MTTLHDNAGLLLIALLVPVVLLPVPALLSVAAVAGILVSAGVVVARWVAADASPGSRAQRDHASPYASMNRARRW